MSTLPPIHALVAFEALVRTRSIARAARELGLSRSAVSRAVALLEDHLQLALVSSWQPQVVLTPAGRACAAPVRNLLEDVEDAVHEIGCPTPRTLRLGLPPELARGLLATRLPALPGIGHALTLVVRTGDPLPLLRTGQCDLAIARRATPAPELLCEPLWSEPCVLAGPPDTSAHGLAGWLDAQGRLRLVVHPELDAAAACATAALPLPSDTPCMVVRDVDLLARAVAAGVGPGVVPARVADAAGLSRWGPEAEAGWRYVLLCRQGTLRRTVARELADWLRQATPPGSPAAPMPPRLHAMLAEEVL